MVSLPRARARATLVLVLTLLAIGGAPTSAAADAQADSASDRVVAWLSAQPASGLSVEERLDLALAYQVGGAPQRLIEPLVDDVEFLLEQGTHVPTRTLAKAIVVLDVAGRGLVLAGGKRDLVAELRAAVGKAPSAPGEFEAAAGDGLVTQAWGILAELRAGIRPRAEVRFLLSQQCPGGWFVSAPTVQSCERPADIVDQALVLNALVSASRSGVPAASGSLLTWLLRQLSAPRSDTPVSALAWLSWPLGVLGHGSETTRIQGRVRALQLTAGSAGDRSQLGAIGGETRALLQDLLKQRLDPPPAVSVAGVRALRPVDLVGLSYRARPTLSTLPRPGMSAVGPDEAEPGDRVRFLVQGLTAGDTVSLAIAGVTGTVASATAGDDGRAIVAFDARSLTSSRQRLEFTTASGERVTGTLSVVRPLVSAADTSGMRPAAEAAERFELTWRQAVAGASLLLLVLVGGSFLLRDQASW